MYIAFITQIVILLGLCFAFLQLDRLSTTVIWSAILTSHVTRLLLTYAVFYRGKWQNINLEIRPRQTVPPTAPVLSSPDEASTEV